MKVRTLLLATALAASVTGAAFAQNSNMDAATKPEQNQTQKQKQDAMKDTKGTAMKPSGATTGAAAKSTSEDPAVSPASSMSGPHKDK